MKNLSKVLVLVLTLLSIFPAASSASATTLSPGDLIKGPGDAVYYYGADAKRYVYPTSKTYATWYTDFSTVKTLALADLQVIPLGGNVTYRPGVRLVKVTTDPKTYAVAKGGVLRWVKTESAAQALYGADWNKKIDDLPDAFFINYTVGTPIESAADYAPTTETSAVANFDANKLTAVPTNNSSTSTNTNTSTSTTSTAQTINFTVSKLTAAPGDLLALSADATDPSGINKIEFFFDGALVSSCSAHICSAEKQIPTSGTLSSYVVSAKATTVNNQVLSKDITIAISNTDGSGFITLTADHAVIAPSDVYSLTAEADLTIAPLRIDIYADDINVKACVSVRVCKYASAFANMALGTRHPIKAVLTDTLGRTYTSAVSYITVGDPGPEVTVATAKTQINVGEMLEVTVSATDSSGISSIDLLKDGAVLKHCTGPAPCTLITGPWNTAGTISFSGSAVALDGATSTGVSPNVSVTAAP